MDLETVIVIQSDISQKEKNRCHLFTHMWNLKKADKPSYSQSRDRDTDAENRRVDTRGNRGGRNPETGIETYTLLVRCLKY